MMRLFLSECKKVWKSKINIILLVAFIGMTLYQGYGVYHRSLGDHLQEEYGSSETEELTGLAWYKKIDEELHMYASDAFSKEEYDRFILDYEREMAHLPHEKINEENMEKRYGKGYKAFFEKAEKGEATQEEVDQFCMQTGKGCSYSLEIEGDKKIYQFMTTYENDIQRMYQNVKTFNIIGETSTIDAKEVGLHFGEVLSHKETYLYPQGEKRKEFLYADVQAGDVEKEPIYEMMNEKFKEQDTAFDSTVPNNVFMDSLSSINVFTLVVIALLCANIFSQESIYKTDQIIVPTKYGSTKVVFAKLLCGLSIGAGVVLLQWLCLTACSFLYLPMRTLDISAMSMGGTWAGVKEFVYTYREVLAGSFFLTFSASLFTAAVTMALSFFTKHRIGTIVPVLLLLFVPIVVPIEEVFHCPQLHYVFPSTAMFFNEYFNGITPYFVWQEHVIALKDVAIYGMLLMSALLCVIMVWRNRKHVVKNR